MNNLGRGDSVTAPSDLPVQETWDLEGAHFWTNCGAENYISEGREIYTVLD